MIQIEYENEDIENLINHRYTGIYKKMKSNATLIADLDKVMCYLSTASSVDKLKDIGSLNYEPLKGTPYHSVRVGYKTKYRLIFHEEENKITIQLIELSEHYGDH